VLREGPIPRFLHGVIEYAYGVIFVAAPFLFGFDEDTAVFLSILVGIGFLVFAASTEGPTGMVNQITLTLHVIADYAIVVLLIAAPFLFDFSGEAASTAFFLIMGMGFLMVCIGTRFRP
jgi:hypothetical protein